MTWGYDCIDTRQRLKYRYVAMYCYSPSSDEVEVLTYLHLTATCNFLLNQY
jgi:hypothetical protein